MADDVTEQQTSGDYEDAFFGVEFLLTPFLDTYLWIRTWS